MLASFTLINSRSTEFMFFQVFSLKISKSCVILRTRSLLILSKK